MAVSADLQEYLLAKIHQGKENNNAENSVKHQQGTALLPAAAQSPLQPTSQHFNGTGTSLWRLRLYKICNWSLNDLEPKKLFISCGTLYKNTPWPTGTVSQNPFKEMWKSDTGGLPNPEHIFGHLIFSMGSIQSIQLSGNVAHSPLLCTWHMHHTLRAAG